MAQLTLTTRVVEVIRNFLLSDKQFTILDITEAVKQDGGDMVAHPTVREIAKPILDRIVVSLGKLSVSGIIVETDNIPVQALVYYPPNTNPEDYKDRKRQSYAAKQQPTLGAGILQLAVQKSQIVPTPVTPPTPNVATSSLVPAVVANARWSAVVKLRADGAVEIPRKAFNEAGLGYDVVVAHHPNSISLAQGGSRSIRWGARLTRQELAAANLGKNGTVTVCAFGDKVVVC
jgi:hypothetical protein